LIHEFIAREVWVARARIMKTKSSAMKTPLTPTNSGVEPPGMIMKGDKVVEVAQENT
jgi:hypothetical protein